MKTHNYSIALVTTLLLLFTGRAVAFTVTPMTMAASDLRKVRTYYHDHPELSVETNYKAFDDHQYSNLRESKNGLYAKNAKAYYTRIMQMEIIGFGNEIISVDHEDKQIILGDNDQPESSIFSQNLDSLLLFCTKVEYKDLGTNERRYIMDFSENEFSDYDKIEFDIDTKNFRYTRLVLYYRAAMNLTSDYEQEAKQPRLEVTYRNYKTALTNSAILQKDNYVLEVNEKTVPVGKLKGYRIVDQRKKTRLKEYKTKK